MRNLEILFDKLSKKISLTEDEKDFCSNTLNRLKSLNNEFYTHSLNLGVALTKAAEALQIDKLLELPLKVFGLTGMLHDSGKIFYPNVFSQKNIDYNVEENIDAIKSHPEAGYNYLLEKAVNTDAGHTNTIDEVFAIVAESTLMHHKYQVNQKIGPYPLQLGECKTNTFARINGVALSWFTAVYDYYESAILRVNNRHAEFLTSGATDYEKVLSHLKEERPALINLINILNKRNLLNTEIFSLDDR